MPGLGASASLRQAMSHLDSFRDHHLPDLLERHYGEWAVLDAVKRRTPRRSPRP